MGQNSRSRRYEVWPPDIALVDLLEYLHVFHSHHMWGNGTLKEGGIECSGTLKRPTRARSHLLCRSQGLIPTHSQGYVTRHITLAVGLPAPPCAAVHRSSSHICSWDTSTMLLECRAISIVKYMMPRLPVVAP